MTKQEFVVVYKGLYYHEYTKLYRLLQNYGFESNDKMSIGMWGRYTALSVYGGRFCHTTPDDRFQHNYVEAKDILNGELGAVSKKRIEPPFCVYTKHLDEDQYREVLEAFKALGFYSTSSVGLPNVDNFTGVIKEFIAGYDKVSLYSKFGSNPNEVTVLSVRELFDLVDKRKESVVDRVFKELDLDGELYHVKTILTELYNKGYLNVDV